MINLLLGENNKYKEEYINSFILSKQKSFPDKFFVVVPEQSNLERQVALLDNESNKSKGLLNIEVSSYNHLAYNFFSYVGYDIKSESMLDEIGKIILLRKLCEENKKKLSYYGNLSSKPGFIDKLKSAISELYLYGVDPDNLKNILNDSASAIDSVRVRPYELEKYKDIAYLYKIYVDKLRELKFTTPDDVIDKFYKMLSCSKGYEQYFEIAKDYYKNVEILFDDFTGITPVQKKIIYALSILSRQVYVCIDLPNKYEDFVNKVIKTSEDIKRGGLKLNEAYDRHKDDLKLTDLFYMSKKYVYDICLTSKLEGVELGAPQYLEDAVGSKEKAARDDISYFCNNILRRKKDSNNIPKASNIKVSENLSIKDEINYVANQICYLVKNENYRYKDMCIITKNSEAYKTYIVNEFKKKEIPFFMDIKINLIDSPYIECLRYALEAVAKNFSTDSVLRFLNSRLFDLDFELDNYIRKLGVSGITRRNAKKGFSYLENEYVDALINFKKAISGTETAEDENSIQKPVTGDIMAQSFRDLIRQLRLDERFEKQQEQVAAEDPYLYKAYAPARDVVENLLDMISSLLKDTKLTLNEFSEVFDTTLRLRDTKILPVRSDQVLIGNLMHSRFVNKKVLFFIGLNTECIPIIENNNSLISDKFKKILGTSGIYLSQDITETAYNSFYYTYMHFKTITDKIYLTYSKTNDDKDAFAPNRIILDAMKMFSLEYDKSNKMPPIYSIKDLREFIVLNNNDEVLRNEVKSAKELYANLVSKDTRYMQDDKFIENIEKQYDEYNASSINPELVKSIVGDKINVSVSSIEQYARCPYKFFLDKLLKLKEREEFEIANNDYGNICHYVLSELFKPVNKNENIKSSENVEAEDSRESVPELTEYNLEDRIKDILIKEKEYLSCQGYTKKVDAIFENIEKILVHSAREIFKSMRDNNFYTADTEGKFKIDRVTSSDKTIGDIKYTLEGRIDRTDVCDVDGSKILKIIDYKTGSILDKISKEDVESAKSLQLLTYMGEARDKIESEDKNAKVSSVLGVYNSIGWGIIEYPSDIDGDGKASKNILQSSDLTKKGLCSDDEIDLIGAVDIKKERIEYDIKSSAETDTKKVTNEDIDEGINLAHKAIDNKVIKILSGNIVCSFKDDDLDESGCDYCPYKSICRHRDFEESEDGGDISE